MKKNQPHQKLIACQSVMEAFGAQSALLRSVFYMPKGREPAQPPTTTGRTVFYNGKI